jgi:hypothetical protein
MNTLKRGVTLSHARPIPGRQQALPHGRHKGETPHMDTRLRAIIQPELVSGERLVWAGRPNRLRLAIPWTLFACVWTGLAALFSNGNPDGELFGKLAMVIGPVFILFGLWLFVMSVRRALAVGATVYAVTDRRALILSAGAQVRSFGPQDLGSLHRRGLKRGDIIFRDAIPRAAGDTAERTGSFTDYGFFGIADPRSVERLIRERVCQS